MNPESRARLKKSVSPETSGNTKGRKYLARTLPPNRFVPTAFNLTYGNYAISQAPGNNFLSEDTGPGKKTENDTSIQQVVG